MRIRSLKKIEVQGKRVLVRADFDVPMRNGAIADDFRIREAFPTLHHVIEKGGMLRVIAHLGRPGGIRKGELSLKKMVPFLERLFKQPVVMVDDPGDTVAFKKYRDSGEIILFDNIRFFPGEERNDSSFARALAQWGDLYVNEAFANAHRAHASVVALPNLLPSYAGFHFEAEVACLALLVKGRPARPFVVVLGGAKLETKLPLITRFLSRADHVLIGGALANTLLSLRGIPMGVAAPFPDVSQEEMKMLGVQKKLYFPEDVMVARSVSSRAPHHVAVVGALLPEERALDIGPRTIERFGVLLENAKTVLWNGPLGCAELIPFSKGTRECARLISTLKAYKVVGGGDTIGVLRKYNLLKGFSHISTGGGAMLEFLSGKKLPALEALKNPKF